MTATFGKLHHETLTLQPGLNVIHAPNEWGKSTWCAFLAAMLYGLDTRAKSTKTALADKERYAPWSGAPMEGRVDIRWKDRDITIERRSKGRVPMGDFRAYETHTGIPVTELTAQNCGSMLLGVERSVFLRSGFVRLSDMPVTNDEALRRRLNALVTTGDERAAGERLAKSLKELKNRCRYNRTGLLPQAEGERDALESTLSEMDSLEARCENLRVRLARNGELVQQLENHRAALAYAAAKEDQERVEQAREQYTQAAARVSECRKACETLPGEEAVREKLLALGQLEMEVEALQRETQLRREPLPPVTVPAFAQGRIPEEALRQARQDAAAYETLTRRQPGWLILGFLLMAAGIGATSWYPVPGICAVGLGLCFLIGWLVRSGQRKRTARKLKETYPDLAPQDWIAAAERYRAEQQRFEEANQAQSVRQAEFRERAEAQAERILQITEGLGLARCRAQWEQARDQWNALSEGLRTQERAENHWKALASMAKPLPSEPEPDALDLDAAETGNQLQSARKEAMRLQSLLSQYMGRMEALGNREQLRKQLAVVHEKIEKLERTYAALTLAQETLAEAAEELQRRFAPRIAKGTTRRMTALTNGRYDRVQLGQDLSLLAGAEGEDTLREALWRSDGTVDQLYLALRLSVAEALIPEAPLILDDALVRFDDTRLKAAMELLKQEAGHRQVILFSCQSREEKMV